MTEAGLGWGEMNVLVNGKSSLELQPPSSHAVQPLLQLSFPTLLTLPCVLLSLKYTVPSSRQSFFPKLPPDDWEHMLSFHIYLDYFPQMSADPGGLGEVVLKI